MSSQGWGSSAMAVYRQTTQVTGKATNATRNFTVARVTGAMDGRPAARVINAGTTLITAPATANGISATPAGPRTGGCADGSRGRRPRRDRSRRSLPMPSCRPRLPGPRTAPRSAGAAASRPARSSRSSSDGVHPGSESNGRRATSAARTMAADCAASSKFNATAASRVRICSVSAWTTSWSSSSITWPPGARPGNASSIQRSSANGEPTRT